MDDRLANSRVARAERDLTSAARVMLGFKREVLRPMPNTVRRDNGYHGSEVNSPFSLALSGHTFRPSTLPGYAILTEHLTGRSKLVQPKRPKPTAAKRIALLMAFAPRKLGSLEQWLVAFCQEMRGRRFEVDVFTASPIHNAVADDLRKLAVNWKSLDALRPSAQSIIGLAKYDLLHITLFTPRQPIPLMAYAAFPARILFFDGRSGGTFAEPEPIPHGLNRVSYRLIGRRLAGLAAASNYVRDRDCTVFGVPEKTRTIYNGVDVTRFRSRRAPSKRKTGLNILAVANLIPEKGIDYLIRAFGQMTDNSSRLTVVGDGPQQQALKNLASELNVDSRVRFLGLRDDVDALLNEADIFVHPATWEEAFGLTIAEAMAAECPVIASSVGGIPELINSGRDGVLVPPRDVPALAKALEELARDPERRQCLGANARTRVGQDFALDRCVQQHCDWCEQLSSAGLGWVSSCPSQSSRSRHTC